MKRFDQFTVTIDSRLHQRVLARSVGTEKTFGHVLSEAILAFATAHPDGGRCRSDAFVPAPAGILVFDDTGDTLRLSKHNYDDLASIKGRAAREGIRYHILPTPATPPERRRRRRNRRFPPKRVCTTLQAEARSALAALKRASRTSLPDLVDRALRFWLLDPIRPATAGIERFVSQPLRAAAFSKEWL